MQTCNPLTARQWFKLRGAINWAVTIVVFIPLVFMLMQLCEAWLAFTIALAVTFCLHFFVLDKRAIGIECPHCGKYIETNTPWICGYKQCRNENVDDFPFIYRCEHCGAEPKAYKCHHCDSLIFFTKDHLRVNYAQCVNLPGKSEPVKMDETLEAVTDLKGGIQVTKLKVEKAKLDVELKGLNKDLEPPPKEKTAFEELEEYFKGMMGNEDAAKKWHAAIDAEFPNDSVEREKRHRVVDQWMANKL
jgi:predicted RNA-binding Zn-ribbon protein involved in translation (DUF1610 family)